MLACLLRMSVDVLVMTSTQRHEIGECVLSPASTREDVVRVARTAV